MGKLLWAVLLPASFAYQTAAAFRNLLYANKWLPVRRLNRPVISIGNITVGGTGKTPATLWLAQRLSERGFSVGILSRGYKRKESRTVIISSDGGTRPVEIDGSDVLAAGDEPAMMARLYGLTVTVAKDRHRAGLELLAQNDVDVLILDDGFQHRKLNRDLDLVLLGEDAPGWVLPCGPFRESARSLKRADCFLMTGDSAPWHPSIPDRPCFRGTLQPQALIGYESNAWKQHPLTLLYRSKILAVAGIANPEKFYRTIHEWDGDIVETLEFPDHHQYSATDWQNINRLSRNVDLIVTTEKDILKLIRFPFARGKLLALRVSMVVDQEEALLQDVIDRIRRHESQGA